MNPLSGLSIQQIREIDALLPHVRYVEGRLKIDGRDAHELLEREGSPLIVYSERRIKDNCRAIASAFRRYFPGVRCFFAVKSCYLRDCLQSVRDEGFGVEVMSSLELQIARQNSFASNDIIANGPGRDDSYHRQSISPPIRMNFLDSRDDLYALNEWATRNGVVADVGLRVNPPIADENGLFVRSSSKLGLDWRDGIFLDVLKEARRLPGVNLRGVVVHQLNHCQSSREYVRVLSALREIILECYREHGQVFDIIDIGGGWDTRFLIEAAGETMESFARVAYEQLSGLPYEYTLQIEPGRFLMADAGIGLTRVLAEKRNAETSWRIADLGSNVLIPLGDLAYHPIPTQLTATGDWSRYGVGDATCAPTDVCSDAELPIGEEGRELALLNCGAYTTVFSELWAFRLPKIVFLRDDGTQRLIFGSEQLRQMFQSFYGYELDV